VVQDSEQVFVSEAAYSMDRPLMRFFVQVADDWDDQCCVCKLDAGPRAIVCEGHQHGLRSGLGTVRFG
jgi:hypothetical protein